MLKTLLLIAVIFDVPRLAQAADEFDRVLLTREHINVNSAPSFLEESLKHREYKHLSVKERLEHDSEFPFLLHLKAEAIQENSLEMLQDRLGGVDLSHYIPHNTFLVFMTHQNAADISEDTALVDWIGNFHPHHKLSESIFHNDEDAMPFNELMVQITSQSDESSARNVMQTLLNRALAFGLKGIEGVTVTNSKVVLKLKDDNHLELSNFLSHQPEVVHIQRWFPATNSNAWAQSILWEGKEEPSNFISEIRTVRNQLDGKGQVVGVVDSGLDYNSCFFRHLSYENATIFKNWTANAADEDISCASDFDESNRKIVQYVGRADFKDEGVGHGTHVTGSILGSLEDEFASTWRNSFRGLAPAAKVAVFDVGVEGVWGLMIPYNLEEDVFDWAYVATARVHSNSWTVPPWILGTATYGHSAWSSDSYMWKHKDFLIVAGAGNEGGCNTRNTIASPANAKSVLAVGASMNSRYSWEYMENPLKAWTYESVFNTFWDAHREDFTLESMAHFSSIGPTDDNRIKPDIIAPGYWTLSAQNNVDEAGHGKCSNSVRPMAGTSMATPQVSGSAVLVRQYFMEGFFPSGVRNESNAFTPSGSLLKAIIINSAVNMNGVKHQSPLYSRVNCTTERNQLSERPSITQGFGRESLDSVMYFADTPTNRTTFIPSLNGSAADVFYDNSISTGEVHTFRYCLSANSQEELRVTLVWTDYPPSELALKKLVNDLDLTVEIGLEETLYGNRQGSYRNEVSEEFAAQIRDDVNPVESVYLTPNSSDLEVDIVVHVTGYNIPFGPQPYSLVLSGTLTEGECGSNSISEPAITRNSVIQPVIPSNKCTSYVDFQSLTATPTTEAPTTEAPTTEAPTTEAPTTAAPSTESPTTAAPSTEAPSTAAPSTEAPTTAAPTTEPPTTAAPTTESPTTQSPSIEPSTTDSPTPVPGDEASPTPSSSLTASEDSGSSSAVKTALVAIGSLVGAVILIGLSALAFIMIRRSAFRGPLRKPRYQIDSPPI